MTDNHEFLADESIIQQKNNVKDYQTLILSEILQTQNLNLTHQFNYNNTKKRFIMMTIKKSKFEKTKKIFAISAFVGLSLLFVQKVYASEAKFEVKSNIPEITTNDIVKLDTIPSKKTTQTNVKIKGKKNIPQPPAPKEFKENELPIPPPPPPASNITAAQFPEGINSLRMNFANIFDSSGFDKEKTTVKTNVYISIDENGKTTNITADGSNSKFNTEVIRAMKQATENVTWKPATENEKPATTVFQFPITMNFQ